MLLSPWLGGTWEAGSLNSGRSVIALLGDLGQVPPSRALCSVYICVENSWPLEILVSLLKKDALEPCCSPGHRGGVRNFERLPVTFSKVYLLMPPSPHLSNGDERTLKGTRRERDSGREGERQGKRQGLWP